MKYLVEEISVILEEYKDICEDQGICDVQETIFIDTDTIKDIDTLYKNTYISYKQQEKEINIVLNTILLEDIPIIKEIGIYNDNSGDKTKNDILLFLQSVSTKIV